MIGRRRDLTEWSWTPEDAPKDYDYGKQPDGSWYCVAPGDLHGNLSAHTVVEHEDGTITVSPSILIGWKERHWHGFIECGVWREV